MITYWVKAAEDMCFSSWQRHSNILISVYSSFKNLGMDSSKKLDSNEDFLLKKWIWLLSPQIKYRCPLKLHTGTTFQWQCELYLYVFFNMNTKRHFAAVADSLSSKLN